MAHGGKQKSDNSSLGRALIKERKKGKKPTGGWLHTTDIITQSKGGITSVTEESSLDEFLRTAELAGTEFTAEKCNISMVYDSKGYTGLPGDDETQLIKEVQESSQEFLCIPRRPQWDKSTSPEELEMKERDGFMAWRRNLAQLETKDKIVLTPFEKNLDFWRQLWRVIERSDVIVQIVDARNPLLFRCEDLERYVKEVDPHKTNMILMNKSDLLTVTQRESWLEYFMSSSDVRAVAFWSAISQDVEEQVTTTVPSTTTTVPSTATTVPSTTTTVPSASTTIPSASTTVPSASTTVPSTATTVPSTTTTVPSTATTVPSTTTTVPSTTTTVPSTTATSTVLSTTNDILSTAADTNSVRSIDTAGLGDLLNTSKLLSCEELLKVFSEMGRSKSGPVTIGLVGYPNVGKSSTINALLNAKKVPVSATPGRTKHFQTLYVNDDVILCDCPGLVFPNFVNSKADMICNGILPIDQMRDHTPPISMVCKKIPRRALESTYGLKIPHPLEGEDPSRLPHAHELLTTYGLCRGFMTSHGQPDQSRSARYILKDFVNGKLLYCEAPPGIDPCTFNTQLIMPSATGSDDDDVTMEEDIPTPRFDERFFSKRQGLVHSKVPQGAAGRQSKPLSSQVEGKGWKKHNNYKKKEKTRRLIGDSNPYNYY